MIVNYILAGEKIRNFKKSVWCKMQMVFETECGWHRNKRSRMDIDQLDGA